CGALFRRGRGSISRETGQDERPGSHHRGAPLGVPPGDHSMTNREATVLVVDDDPAMRDALEALLGMEDYRVLLARTGEEGIRLARSLQPDLVLLDVMMPTMNGYEVCRILRQDHDLSQLPIVMVTALDDRESRLRGIQAG